MKIVFYINYSSDETVRKNIANALEFECALKRTAGVSVKNPVVEIAGDYAQIAGYNYAYIEDFNRYYYITDVNFYRAGYFMITLRCDVLMSFYDEFAGNLCVASRNQNSWNQYITDNKKTTEQDELIDHYVFNVPEFNGASLLLIGSSTGYKPNGDPIEPPEE